MPPKRKNSKADEENESFPLKPPRSYTSYQIFFQLERHYILQTNSKLAAELPEYVDQGAADRPEKYRNIILPRDWYVVGVNRKKRQDHVNHGIISFDDLTKTISHNWNTADLETRMYCKDLAEMELTRYREFDCLFLYQIVLPETITHVILILITSVSLATFTFRSRPVCV